MELPLYDAVKDQFKTGDMLLWQTNNTIGSAIQIFTKSIYSHASLIIRLAEYEGLERHRFTTESLRYGTVLNLVSRRLKHQKGHTWWFPLKDEWDDKRQLIGERALSFVGIKYDFKAIFKFLLGNVLVDLNKLFCSELVYVCYGFSGTAPTPAGLIKLGIHKNGVQIL